jgi:hypothetical protein
MRAIILTMLSLPYFVIAVSFAQVPPVEGGPPIKWVKVTEPMEKHQWSVIEDIAYLDNECKSDATLPRVCLYRHLSKCRIITTVTPSKLPQKVLRELTTMCNGWFPEPVLLAKNFSDPAYLPNQAAPSADPVFKSMSARGIETTRVKPDPMQRQRRF